MGWRPRDQFQRFRWGRPVRLQPPMGRLGWRAGTRYLRHQRQRDGELPFALSDTHRYDARADSHPDRELPLAWVGSRPDRIPGVAKPVALWHRRTRVGPFRAEERR